MLKTRVAEVAQRHEGTFVKEFDLEFWALTYAILSQYYYLLQFMHFLGVLGTTVLPTSITLWKINPQYMDKPKFTAGTLERVLSDIDLNGDSLPTKASEKMSRESNKPKTGYTRGIKTRPYPPSSSKYSLTQLSFNTSFISLPSLRDWTLWIESHYQSCDKQCHGWRKACPILHRCCLVD